MQISSTSYVRLFFLALLLRLAFFLAVGPWKADVENGTILRWDARGYHELAVNLATHAEFVHEPGGPADSLRTPLYPFFVALVYMVFGAKPWIVILLQLLLDSLTCVLVFFLLNRFASTRIALAGGVVYALDPFLMMYANELLSESIFILILVVGLIVLARSTSWFAGVFAMQDALVGGGLFGLATLTRPIALYLIVLIPAFVVLAYRRQLRQAARWTALFGAGFLIVLAPWVVRNAVVFGAPILSTSGSLNFLVLYVAPMEASRQGRPAVKIQEQLLMEADSLIEASGLSASKATDVEKASYWNQLAWRYIRDDLPSFFKSWVKGTLHSFVNLESRGFAEMLNLPRGESQFNMKSHGSTSSMVKEFFQQKSAAEIGIAGALVLLLVFQYGFGVLGLFAAWRVVNARFLLFCVFMSTYFILLAGPYGLARFRMPAVPFYIIFIGIGMDTILTRLDRLKDRKSSGV